MEQALDEWLFDNGDLSAEDCSAIRDVASLLAIVVAKVNGNDAINLDLK